MDGFGVGDSVEKKVCVIGVKSSGKSLALEKVESAIYDKRLGYPSRWSIMVHARSESLTKIADSLSDPKGISTSVADEHWYVIGIDKTNDIDSAPSRTSYKIKILDVPGEIFTNPTGSGMAEEREKYDDWKKDCDGAVVMFATPHLFDRDQAKYLIDEIKQIASLRAAGMKDGNPGKGPERLVIAVTMSELLTVPYGPFAAEIGADPGFMKRVLQAALEDLKSTFFRTLRDIRSQAAEGNLDIRVIPVSTFGYFPKVGSANLSPDIENLVVEGSPNCQPYHPQKYYPLLVADPFIFAATGEDNAFLFQIDEFFA